GKTVSEEENFTYELEPGVFEVSLEVEIGRCSYEFSQEITVEEAPQANAGAFKYATEILDCGQWALSAIALQESPTATYQWWLNDELVSEEERVSKSIPSGDYTLTLQTQIGSCSYETQEILSLSSPQADLLVNVPNVLSPQAIHPDDRTIKVYGKCIADEGFHFQIADRWGGLVYQTKNANEAMTQGWNGDNASSGIYTYVLKGQFNSGTTFQQQGTITLLK
ncbi:MAG: gliding motility-associated C-terminal domain-containing protein, partial [Bacteroidota bacterium]